ncbi:hypothetical protein WR25_23405 [Diploscapter pachys]|uniref:Pre-mRNA-splicing factor SPF27 n=1 Tax=Diploscapter pachys TaxID=2018661 RepID=A0A2A2JML1_9BILA|nr:hypothetical protein WR25_23405 [Diploscapter pachys]
MNKPVLAIGGPAGVSSINDEQVLVDALPYLDTEYNESDRQLALRLIENECKVFRPTKNYLRHLQVPDYDVFLTPCIQKEFARISKKQEMPKLDMSRCELPSPAGTSKAADKAQWRKAIRNAKAQNEHLVLREINLEMLDEFGPEMYLQRNKQMEQTLIDAEKELRRAKEQVMNVHSRRKMAQMEAGAQMRQFEADWVAMITNNYKMELAIDEMEESNQHEVKRLRLDESLLNVKLPE